MNGERIFHTNTYKMTAPFGEWRDNHTRQHKGTDYGTFRKELPQYSVLDRGLLYRIINVERAGQLRGLLVDIRYDYADIGIIHQHLSRVAVPMVGKYVDKTDIIGYTGMTGKYASGKRVSSGIHAHIELYQISTGKVMDFDAFNFERIENMHLASAAALVLMAINKAHLQIDNYDRLVAQLSCYWNTPLRYVVEKLVACDYTKASPIDGSKAIFSRTVKAVQVTERGAYNNALMLYGENAVFYLIKKLLDALGVA